MASQAQEPTPSARRRRVRKGTRSCWECKRRKIRCLYATPDDNTCIGCHHRRIPCVSQEMPENLSPAVKGNRHLSDRIARIEDVMKDWLVAGPRPPTQHPFTRARHKGLFKIPDPDQSFDDPTPQTPSLISSPKYHGPYADDTSDSQLTALNHLLAALPRAEDVQILLRASAQPSLYTELIATQPRSKLTQETLATPPSLPVDFPGLNPHPVILARWMLLFAITLQSPCGDEVLELAEPSSLLMRRLTTAVKMWVTTMDTMQRTIEGLICIILEAVFETNAGNLRSAWTVYRRALTVGQLMGLHLSPRPRPPRIDATLEVDLENLWFRIVYMDRYLSLLLGLPQGTSDQRMAVPSIMQHEPPLGQFERHLTVIAGRILEQKQASTAASADLKTTQAIDTDLLMASHIMPASFWRPANFNGLTVGSPETLLETVRLGAQVYYYGLLIHLHLPYLMREVSGQDNPNSNINPLREYSKTICVNSSREILLRFIAHRSFNPMSSCSRPVDFFALLAAMTLLLAHLDAHGQHGSTMTVINPLAHQRLCDRAMLDQALECMDAISHVNNDITSRQSATLIQRLLDIEADAAGGNRYTTHSVSTQDPDESNAAEQQSMQELSLQIPYLGLIRIVREGLIVRELWPTHGNDVQQTSSDTLYNVAAASSSESCPDEQPQRPGSRYHNASDFPSHSCGEDISLKPDISLPTLAGDAQDWAFQGVDMAFFDTLMRGMPCLNANETGLE